MVVSSRREKISVSSGKQRLENGARNLPMRIVYVLGTVVTRYQNYHIGAVWVISCQRWKGGGERGGENESVDVLYSRNLPLPKIRSTDTTSPILFTAICYKRGLNTKRFTLVFCLHGASGQRNGGEGPVSTLWIITKCTSRWLVYYFYLAWLTAV